jgi:hypothetical protein
LLKASVLFGLNPKPEAAVHPYPYRFHVLRIHPDDAFHPVLEPRVHHRQRPQVHQVFSRAGQHHGRSGLQRFPDHDVWLVTEQKKDIEQLVNTNHLTGLHGLVRSNPNQHRSRPINMGSSPMIRVKRGGRREDLLQHNWVCATMPAITARHINFVSRLEHRESANPRLFERAFTGGNLSITQEMRDPFFNIHFDAAFGAGDRHTQTFPRRVNHHYCVFRGASGGNNPPRGWYPVPMKNRPFTGVRQPDR